MNTMPLSSLKRLTNNNAHTEAYIMGAKALGRTDLVKKLEAVKATQDQNGYLPYAQSQIRYGLYQEMLAAAKQQLSPMAYEKFYGCF
jgi:hypothetical protein